ncbi:uncharacterized protein METZ01_LOCUS488236, partial [marine metagenome]
MNVVLALPTGTIRLMDAAGTEQLSFGVNSTIYIKVVDVDDHFTATAIDLVTVSISSQTETTPETVTLTETGINNGVFTGSISVQESASAVNGDLILQVNTHDK